MQSYGIWSIFSTNPLVVGCGFRVTGLRNSRRGWLTGVETMFSTAQILTYGDFRKWRYPQIIQNYIDHFLVGGFKHSFYFPSYGIILPIDELHHFSRWLLHHQPVFMWLISSTIQYPWMNKGHQFLPRRGLGVSWRGNYIWLIGKQTFQ
jgi:hypothetical protein